MHCLVVDIGRDGGDIAARIAVRFLLIGDEMLSALSVTHVKYSKTMRTTMKTYFRASHHAGRLHACDCFGSQAAT